jgi:hypothetical protein
LLCRNPLSQRWGLKPPYPLGITVADQKGRVGESLWNLLPSHSCGIRRPAATSISSHPRSPENFHFWRVVIRRYRIWGCPNGGERIFASAMILSRRIFTNSSSEAPRASEYTDDFYRVKKYEFRLLLRWIFRKYPEMDLIV